MDRIECAELVRKSPGISRALVPSFGTSDPEPLAIGSRYVIQSPVGPSVVGRTKLAWAGKKPTKVENQVAGVSLGEKDRVRLRDLYAKHGRKPDVAKWLSSTGDGAATEPQASTTLALGKPCEVGKSGNNRALRIDVRTAGLATEFGGRKAGDGLYWLLLDIECTNVIPLQFVYDRQCGTSVQIPKMTDRLYLVADGKTLIPMQPWGEFAQELALPHVGSAKRGDLLFTAPVHGIETLELRCYDYAHGHVTIPLVVRPKETEAPELTMVKNELFGAGVSVCRKAKEFAGKKAPDGRTFVVVELLTQSATAVDADATAFDGKAKPGQKTKVGALGNWPDARKSIRLAVGQNEYAPEADGTLPDSVRLLPDVPTGGTLAFLVPEGTTKCALRLAPKGAQPLSISCDAR